MDPSAKTDNAWKTTTWMLAILLAVSTFGNVELALRFGAQSNAGAALSSGSGSPAADPQRLSAPNVPPEGVAHVSAGSGSVLGAKTAKVEVIAFLDYECFFCARFYRDSFVRLERDYIASGKVRFVTRDYPLPIHSRARPAAFAADCVRRLANNDTYYRFQKQIYTTGDLTDAALTKDAVDLGISADKLHRCLADKDGGLARQIDRDQADAAAAGVIGTPTFFVNGRMLVGAQPYYALKAVIEAELLRIGAT